MRKHCTAAIAATFVSLCAATAHAQQQPLANARVVPIQVTGDPAARFSLVVLGDGYTASELPMFRAHVDKHLNVLWSIEPFRSYRSYINVYAVEIASPVSGITCDPAHRERRATPLGLNFSGGCTDPNARGIVLDAAPARRYAALATPHFDQILVIANTDTYGGIGGSVATTSGGNSLGPLITPHELGHSLGRLQDEYTYSARGVRGGTFAGTEPNSAHHSLLTEEQMRTQRLKWWRWLGEESLSGGRIGRFEGGQQQAVGVWRPSKHSMMISLGYSFDQVSREQMVRRISAQVELIAASTPADAPVGSGDVIWIETAHPVYHDLDITWSIDGRALPNPNNSTTLDLRQHNLGAGEHTVGVTVIDATDFVRDPVLRDSVLTARRTWRVAAGARTAAPPTTVTGATQTERAVGGTDVIYVETPQPVQWTLDGNRAQTTTSRFHLARQNLTPGTHTLVAQAAGRTFTWRVDNTKPSVAIALHGITTMLAREETRHAIARDSFWLQLQPTDDQPGYVVAEFRVNGDGWHHYYGWPDAPEGTPFMFTPRGTMIKELVYGSLSAEGLSPQPWEPREPGWGTHRIEYRAIDAAGNIGDARALHVTFLPSRTCTTTIRNPHNGDVHVTTGVTCIENTTVTGSVDVQPGASLVVTRTAIDGAVTAHGAAAVELIEARVQRDVRIDGTSSSVLLFDSNVGGSVSLTGSTTRIAPVIAGNTVTGEIACSGNSAAPQHYGTTNRARTTTGQCR
jgi:hypothetical protein